MKKLLFCLLPLSVLLAPPVHANLSIHPMRAAVDTKRGTQIRVYSHSTQPQYVQARLLRISNPAEVGEEEMEVEAADAAVAITPAKFALSGGGNRLIRVIPLRAVEKEAAYRVYFEGVRGPDGTLLEDDEQAAQANVGVSLVWGALVNVLPANGSVDLQLQGDTLRNVGNLRVGITGLAECSADGVCKPHDFAKSLYPDAELKLPFLPQPDSTLQLHYRLSKDGYRDHTTTLAPSA
ncbi:TPA: pilus assembly protein [Stenotrophomonas maltophilia]|uniref:pilus assembly protein n=1 Tax=Stenotrophomonas maltophilia TaxID=40324 RepID=UPI0025569A45|nr:pilus assembly protein [Stenotrophomonas maltophilia]HEL3738778.1 pilus assembly protein [Stenotrophomonas maltophilia]HEL5572936.1 pilus assembly protein [Stenotrophomonas maltophilia]